jgi:hypothetical protein
MKTAIHHHHRRISKSTKRPRLVDWTTSAALRMDKRALPNLSAKTSATLLKDSQ